MSSLRLSLKRADHGKLLRCQVPHPALTAVMDIKTFLDVQCKWIGMQPSLDEVWPNADEMEPNVDEM